MPVTRLLTTPPLFVIAAGSTERQEVRHGQDSERAGKSVLPASFPTAISFAAPPFLLASTTAAFELLGRLSPRRLAWASLPITLDLSTTDLASQGYDTIGSQPFGIDTTAQRLTITDGALDGNRFFVRACPEIPTSTIELDITLRIDPASVTLRGEDTGVHVVLGEGTGTVGITGREILTSPIARQSSTPPSPKWCKSILIWGDKGDKLVFLFVIVQGYHKHDGTACHVWFGNGQMRDQR